MTRPHRALTSLNDDEKAQLDRLAEHVARNSDQPYITKPDRARAEAIRRALDLYFSRLTKAGLL
jgi:hypothetical protein